MSRENTGLLCATGEQLYVGEIWMVKFKDSFMPCEVVKVSGEYYWELEGAGYDIRDNDLKNCYLSPPRATS